MNNLWALASKKLKLKTREKSLKKSQLSHIILKENCYWKKSNNRLQVKIIYLLVIQVNKIVILVSPWRRLRPIYEDIKNLKIKIKWEIKTKIKESTLPACGQSQLLITCLLLI